MEKRNRIELTERFRQTGATRELVAKFFGDKDSILIVQDPMLRSVIIANHLNCHDKTLEELSNSLTTKSNNTKSDTKKLYLNTNLFNDFLKRDVIILNMMNPLKFQKIFRMKNIIKQFQMLNGLKN